MTSPSPADQFLTDYLRHGMTPFFGLPMVDASDPAKAYAGCRAVFLGVPHDLGTSQFQGARYAPYSIRKASIFALNGPFPPGRAVDAGNVPAPFGSPAKMRELVESAVADVLGAGAVPLIVGGDHSVALPVMRAVAKKHGPLAVVHVDAHPDTSAGSQMLSVDEFHHGAPLLHALKEGLIAPGGLHQVGVRLAHDEALAAAHGVKVYSMDEISDFGVANIASRIRRAIGERATYVTFDIDAVDPAYAPGTGTPVPGGLSSREALRLVRGLAELKLVGMDVVEVLPALDHADLTSLLAANLLWEGLTAVAAR